MYIPKHFEEERVEAMHAVMRDNSFALLVTADGSTPFATHLPLLLDGEGEFGTLRGHLARPNPQWRAFDGTREAMVVFSGPHAYISPSWYETDRAVPTWNYIAVHAYGRPRVIEDAASVAAHLKRLVDTYEGGQPAPWSADSLPPEYFDGMARGVVAFEMVIERLEGKAKLSQNRPDEVHNVIAALGERGDPGSMAVASAMWRM